MAAAEKMEYLAHIAPDGRQQTVVEHLQATAKLCRAFADAFGASELGNLTGLAHDIGKFSREFQKRLQGGPRVDHATAGALACAELGQPSAAFAVMGHHGGLPDGARGVADGGFFSRLERAQHGQIPDCSPWREAVPLPKLPPARPTDSLQMAFFTRMLYSCLVDADYLDTEAFMEGAPRNAEAPTLETLWQKLETYIARWFPPDGELNASRCAVLKQCIRQGETQKPGLFTLTVPTGGGKTVASLAFALAHARANGLRRVVYVIPYTSIIEQTADTFRSILGEEAVLEHHSNLVYDTSEETGRNNHRMAQATENWDMPVIVTTAVQFFESLYSNRSSSCRKLHNLAKSVILFDEAQMLPVPYLRPCVHAISELVRGYGASAVLCTATQPALQPLFREFLPETNMVELCPAELCPPPVFRRVTFQRAGKLPWAKLAELLQAQEQALCVVDSRRAALEVFGRLTGDGNFHLSTLMYPAHRRRVLAEVRRRLASGEPCRVVSTSLIEAGVDVDFPTVFREEAGLDSILQAAGRCNREGKCPASRSVVTIFQPEDPPPVLFQTAIGACREALERHQDPADAAAIQDYFETLLDLKGSAAQDKDGILETIRRAPLPFSTVAERFRLIDSPTRTVYIPLEEGIGLVRHLREGARSRALFRKLGLYGVTVYERHFEALDRAGDLEILEDGSAILRNPALYRDATGLSLEADSGKAEFI